MTPIVYRYDGESMVPEPRFKLLADQLFTAGETYALQPPEDDQETRETRNEFFLLMRRAFDNLPAEKASKFLNEEQFRKHALIRCGYATERVLVLDTPSAANRAASFMRGRDDYAIIIVSGCTVQELTAKTQMMGAMRGKQFNDVKTEVIQYVCNLLGCTPQELRDNVRMVA